MKSFIAAFSLAFFVSGITSAQGEMVLTNCPEDYQPHPEKSVLRYADMMPSWRGCERIEFPAKREKCTSKEVEKYAKENLVYPERAKSMYLEGDVWIKFVVEENGCLSNISISRTLGGHTGWEAQKLVRGMPYWNPGMDKGSYARVEMSIPIHFEYREN